VVVRPVVAALVLSLFLAPAPLAAQLEPPSTGGLGALDLSLRPLARYQRVLMIAAHPDDEDTELLTLLARGMGAEAAYLSLTRGEGGQNLIGQELGPGLGLLRTEELLAARRLDGARQFFTRAYDFGFSKSLDDTWAHWPRDSLLKDVVRIVRKFRPQVIVAIFSGTARDGHGQHQASGWLAREAFRVAGDPNAFPELSRESLAPWTPAKLYRNARYDTAGTTLRLPTGMLDPAEGQSYHQIAMRGRSLHRSQDMGQLQRLGPSEARLALLEDRTGQGTGGIFAGLDTTLAGAPFVLAGRGVPRRQAEERLRSYAARIDSARQRIAPGERTELRALLARAADDLAEARRHVLTALPGNRGDELQRDPWLQGDPFEGEFRRLWRARLRAAEVLGDVVSTDERVIPGQELELTASLWNPSSDPADAFLCIGDVRFGFAFPDPVGGATLPRSERRGACLGYNARTASFEPAVTATGTLPPGGFVTGSLKATVPATEDYTTPYFLRAPREGDLYTWDEESWRAWGDPFEEPPLWYQALLKGPEPQPRMPTELTLRGNDQATGEYRRPVVVVPRVDVAIAPEEELWPVGSRARRVTVTLTHGARDTTGGLVALEVPPGWTAPPPQRFRLTGEDERRSFVFELKPPAGLKPGRYEVAAVARDERGRVYDVGLGRTEHPHIHPRTWSRRAVAVMHAAPLTLPRLRSVAYVRGAADRVPEALRRAGVPLTLLRGAELGTVDLARFDVVVIGPRAYEVDPDLGRNNGALLAYARAGGTVLVQYQQYGYFLGDYAPFALTVGSRAVGAPISSATPTTRESVNRAPTQGLLSGHDRVTDEQAPVRIVDPQSPVVLRPNRLTSADWDGWVQERGLYFARTWAPEWKPVLSMHDPGEQPLEGGLLIAKVGRGTYVYTGLAFFRQLPAGVPGAFRLFANLLALGERRASGTPAQPRAPAESYDIEKP
jgi:LmbE family N-acetylglucosaminyl deacetylase